MAGCCFSFWVDSLRSVLPSSPPDFGSVWVWCHGPTVRDGAGSEPGLHQTRARHCSRKTSRNRKALLSSVAVYHQKTDLEWAVLHRWGCQSGGEGCEPTFSLLFVSVFLCSALSELSVQGERKWEYQSWCQVATASSFTCNPFSWCRAITKYSTCQFSEGQGYFQRMKINFTWLV